MGLQASILATVSSITKWTVRYENMGLLNVLFEPTGNSTFKTNSNINDIVNYLINVTLERPLSLSVLQALPSKIGGGAEGVKVANANPNREPIILWTTVTVFIFFLVWIIILQIVNCRRCYCCRNTRKRSLRRLKMPAVDVEFTNKRLLCRIAYWTLMALSLLFLIASVALTAIYFSSANMVISFIHSTTPSQKLNHSFDYINNLFEKGISSGVRDTNEVINSFTMQVNVSC
ncbi:unnamed protein product [Hymenolepis diminuta]|uniref:Uncharacterized protein n=1 Tax=Hymenolepis diminuta TaxID=6216 RepID=A0A564Z894_HYMDI|nr:unnamed protein product [Hymenolepis diminuta]